MTYNYLLNPFIRKNLNKFQVFDKNSIVILDEAHNICNIFENIYSNKITNNDIEKIKNLLQLLLDFINKKQKNYYMEYEHINPLFHINENILNKEINTTKMFLADLEQYEKDNNQEQKKSKSS